jgi:hypothetical protein
MHFIILNFLCRRWKYRSCLNFRNSVASDLNGGTPVPTRHSIMLSRWFRLLFGHVPFEVPSAFSLQDSVERLRLATKRCVFSALFKQAAVGRVTASDVRLQRVIPMFGNSFKPVFLGSFELVDGRVVLRGKFTMFRFAKIFMSLWLSFALVWTIFAVLVTFVIFGPRNSLGPEVSPVCASLFPFIGIIFFVIGILFVRFCWWLSRSDIKFLTGVMTDALQDRAAPSDRDLLRSR